MDLKTRRGRPRKDDSQRNVILDYLKQGHTLTRMEAIEKFSCTELPARIHELRQLGIKIESQPYVSRNGVHLVRYAIPGIVQTKLELDHG